MKDDIKNMRIGPTLLSVLLIVSTSCERTLDKLADRMFDGKDLIVSTVIGILLIVIIILLERRLNKQPKIGVCVSILMWLLAIGVIICLLPIVLWGGIVMEIILLIFIAAGILYYIIKAIIVLVKKLHDKRNNSHEKLSDASRMETLVRDILARHSGRALGDLMMEYFDKKEYSQEEVMNAFTAVNLFKQYGILDIVPKKQGGTMGQAIDLIFSKIDPTVLQDKNQPFVKYLKVLLDVYGFGNESNLFISNNLF